MPHLLDVLLLVLLVRRLIRVLETRLILVGIGRHQALDGQKDRLEALGGGPLLASLAAPCPGLVLNLARACGRKGSYPRMDLQREVSVAHRSQGSAKEMTYKQTRPLEYIFGLNRHRPPFVVIALTVGDLRG